MSAESDGPAVVVLVGDGPEAGLRLRYVALPGEDAVTVTDSASGDAVVARVFGLIAFDYPRVEFEPEYFDRLNYHRKDLRDTSRGHYQDAMRGRSVR